jgi:hypothetical protein
MKHGSSHSVAPAAAASLALTFALLLLSLALMALLAQADSTSRTAGAPQADRLVRQPEARTGLEFTDPMTFTVLLPLTVQGHVYPPPPLPWRGEVVATYPNCTLTRLFGYVLDQNQELVGDVWVHYWADNWDGRWVKSSWDSKGDHNWDGTVDIRPREVLWYACVAPNKNSWDCLSNRVDAPTSADCENGIQVYQIDFHQN